MRVLLLGVLSVAVTFSTPAAFHQSAPVRVLTGTVTTGAGAAARPVRRAKVTLSGPSFRVPRVADTDANGVYRFDRLPSGDFRIRVQKAGFVTLDADAAPGAALSMERGGAIEGVVADANGDPVPNVLVTALQPRSDRASLPTHVADARTDDLGRYRLHSLSAGNYVVWVRADASYVSSVPLTQGERRPAITGGYYPAAVTIDDARSVPVSAARDTGAIDITFTPPQPEKDPAAPPAARIDRTGTGRIAGIVTDAASGKPIRMGQILLLPAAGQGPRLTDWTRTDARGRFEYTSLPAQRYTLQVVAPRYVPLEYGQKRPGETGTQIDLRDGEDFRADMKLPRTSALEGTLLDEFGDPAPSVTVRLAQRQYAAGRHRLMPVAGRGQVEPSDDRGRFRVMNLAPGDYYVAALPGVFTDANEIGGFAPTYYPGTVDSAAAMPVTVAFGADAHATFPLVPATTVSIAGTMVDEMGMPVGRGTLILATPDRLRRIDFNLARSVAAPDGSFVLRNVPTGLYTLQGFGPPAGTHSLGREHGPLNLGAMRFGWLPLDVGDADIDGVVLTVTNGRMLKGQIVLEDSVAPPPKPDQVRVTAIPVEFDSAPIGGGPPPSQTRADWSFEVTALSGVRRIFVSVASPQWALKKISAGGADITDAPVDFRGKDLESVEVVITPKVSRVTGGVTDDKGPVADYAVVIFPVDPTKWIDRSRFVAMSRPTQQGRFTVSGLPPEDYLAVALPNVVALEYMDPEFLQPLRPLATAFTLAEGEQKALELKLKRRP